MTACDVDYAIIGGGCSGLSLAVQMCEQLPATRRMALIESRTEYHQDRTWCYWALQPHRFSDAVTHRWTKWQIGHHQKVLQSTLRYPYEHLPSAIFYERAFAILNRHPQLTIHLGCNVIELAERHQAVSIITDRGELTAHTVFDSRPPHLNVLATPGAMPKSAPLLQHFVGQHIQIEQPLFTADTVTLMDFDIPKLQERGIAFMYVLPFRANQALVEATLLSTSLLPPAEYRAAIKNYLTDRYGITHYQINDEERGVIPMAIIPTAITKRRIYRIGTAGGAVKASTGYAFLTIQKWSEHLARYLVNHDWPDAPRIRSAWTRGLDQIFINYLTNHPDQAPALFRRLFEHVKAESLVRFLNDQAHGQDTLAVMQAMPTMPFLWAALCALLKVRQQ